MEEYSTWASEGGKLSARKAHIHLERVNADCQDFHEFTSMNVNFLCGREGPLRRQI